MKKYIHDFKVVRNRNLSDSHFILELECIEELPEILPGQFVEVMVENSKTTFLRRPFSIHDVNYEENTISLFIKRVGEGSKFLGYVEEGDYINIIYPLGNGFTTEKVKNVLLVGGGCGIAPMMYLSKKLSENNINATLLVGGKCKEEIYDIEHYQKYVETHITTDDGSFGEKGFVSQHSLFYNKEINYDMIYVCGPEPMMKAVAKIAKEKNIPCEVSLENTMACGVGACLCCVTETTEGNKCVCTEGPVFNVNDLKW